MSCCCGTLSDDVEPRPIKLIDNGVPGRATLNHIDKTKNSSDDVAAFGLP